MLNGDKVSVAEEDNFELTIGFKVGWDMANIDISLHRRVLRVLSS